MSTGNDAVGVPTDNPIESSAEDLLGRAPLARDFAQSLRRLDVRRGAVVGIFGPWGHGKSSFVNLMREELAAEPPITVIDFNPWMFSGTQQLVEHFFNELSTHLKKLGDPKLAGAAKLVDDYGDSIASVAGLLGPLGILGVASVRGIAKRLGRQRGASEKKKLAAAELAKLDDPILVVIDDIDRLTSEEIRDIFKLVRLTASFPNVIYLLAFDRARVEQALTEPGIAGRAYLEKIIQVSFDLPATPDGVLTSRVFSALQAALDEVEGEPRFKSDRWADTYFEIIAPMLTNMRDVARYATSVRSTLSALATEIEVVDLLAMEAFRIFRPEIFAQLRGMRAALTEISSRFGSGKSPAHQAAMDSLRALAGEDDKLVVALVNRVLLAGRRYLENMNWGFDITAEWRRNHQLAHADFLGMYFDRVAPASLEAFRLAETLRFTMVSPSVFETLLDSIEPASLPDVLSAFESFQGDFPEDHIASTAAALLNRVHRVPESQVLGTFTMAPAIVVIRPVLRMLEQVRDDERTQIVRDIFTSLTTYSSRLDLIESVGRRQQSPNLIPVEVAEALEVELIADFASAPPSALDREWGLARVYYFISERGGDSAPLAQERRADVTRAILESVRGSIRAQSMDSRHVRTQATYRWDGLVGLYGTEGSLREAVAELRMVDGDSEAVLLAERYLSGWRPRDDNDLHES